MSIKTALLAFIPISKEIRRAEREYIDMSPPPINALHCVSKKTLPLKFKLSFCKLCINLTALNASN